MVGGFGCVAVVVDAADELFRVNISFGIDGLGIRATCSWDSAWAFVQQSAEPFECEVPVAEVCRGE
jgi:hypothetical protein